MKDAKRNAWLVSLVLLGGLLAGSASMAQAQSSPAADRDQNQNQAAASAEQPWQTLAAGTVIQVRIADEVNSSKLHDGDLITGIVDPSVLVDGHAVIPRGTEAHMRVVEDKKGHALGGKAKVELQLVALVMDREKVGVDAGKYGKTQGALSYKVKSATRGAASSGTATATMSATPEAGAVNPIVAVFSAAKVDIRAGQRIPFRLDGAFSFQEPTESSALVQ